LWRWYINITITILDIIHRPVFYLRLNSTLQVCLYLTGNTLCLRYEPNRLMLYIGLWRWYINILVTITILDIIHCPIFYLKLNSTLQVCVYLTGNTLCLRYEPNRLMLYIGLWRWFINILVTITILDIIHRPIFYFKHFSGTGFCLRLQVETTHLGPMDRASLRRQRLALSIWPNWVDSTWRRILCPVSETTSFK
jgi:hypothetical protein